MSGGGLRVEAREVSRSFAVADGAPVRAVEGLSLVVEPGELVALRGRSGSGKTTLLCLLGGLDRPTSGSVLVDGTDLAGVSRSERTRLLRASGFVFQSAATIPRLPVWENVTAGLVPLGVPPAERRELARTALEVVALEHAITRRPEALSAGERQRVALARALIHVPRLVLADEPTSSLDPESAEIVCDVLTSAHRDGCTTIIASHDERVLERADRIVDLRAGRLVAL